MSKSRVAFFSVLGLVICGVLIACSDDRQYQERIQELESALQTEREPEVLRLEPVEEDSFRFKSVPAEVTLLTGENGSPSAVGEVVLRRVRIMYMSEDITSKLRPADIGPEAELYQDGCLGQLLWLVADTVELFPDPGCG